MENPATASAETAPGGRNATVPDPQTRGATRLARRVRRWARVAFAAQLAFVASWLVAAAWQGPRYSVVRHSISDMYAETAPHAAFLIVVLTICGAASIWFAWRSVWPALRAGGRWAAAGAGLLALSIFGLGDLLTVTERLRCRLADPGCTAAKQLSNAGGTLDNTLSTVGVLAFVIAGFLLAVAMKRTAGWAPLARFTRWVMVLVLALTVCDGVFSASAGGLFERLLALAGAAWIAVLAVAVTRRPAATRA